MLDRTVCNLQRYKICTVPKKKRVNLGRVATGKDKLLEVFITLQKDKLLSTHLI